MLPGNNSTGEMAQCVCVCVYIPCHFKRCKGRVKETEKKKGRKVERREGGGRSGEDR